MIIPHHEKSRKRRKENLTKKLSILNAYINFRLSKVSNSRDSLESIKTAIEQCPNPQTRKELQEKYDKMRRIVEHAEGIPALFAKNMTRKDGKYIVFCKDKQHMDELITASKEWFADIDTNPEIYSRV